MKNSAKHLALAVLTVVLVVVFGQLSPQNLPAVEGQTSILEVGASITKPSAEVQLTLSLPQQATAIGVSSQSEVLFFDLEAGAPYTLRYLTLVVDSQGVELAETPGDWKLYEVEKGRVDFGKLVGYGEVFENGFLRLRLFSDPAAGYSGRAGLQSFALVAPIYKNGIDEPFLKLTFPLFLPEDLDWEFVEREEARSWMDLEADEILGASSVEGLTSETLVKE